MTNGDLSHVPVLLEEIVSALDLVPGKNVLDGTVGGGGHAAAILERIAPDGRYLGIDLDEVALETARKNLDRFGSRVMLVRGSYRDAVPIATAGGFEPVQAALLDLGFSSLEIDDPTRGFSFRFDGPLDMRYDRRQKLTAAEIVNLSDKRDLETILRTYGEEKFAGRIAAAVVEARKRGPITGTQQLVDVIGSCVPATYRNGRLHFATRTFQALRIAVNDELGSVKVVLPELVDLLESGGRLGVISFHSLEDRIVKQTFRELAKAGKIDIVTKRPIIASEDEARHNPRARSAKLRVAVIR